MAKNFRLTVVGHMMIATLALVTPTSGQSPEWEAFGALVVGQWQSDDARQELEWGVGRQAITSRGYFLSGDEWILVSEGLWYWDPEAGTVRGLVIAIEMPVERFEYASSVDGTSVTHRLKTFGPAGGEYVERWSFTNGGYQWDLFDPDESERIMGGSYRLVPNP